jgi:hypothetical protein
VNKPIGAGLEERMSVETHARRTAPVKTPEEARLDLLKHINTVRERLSAEFQPRVAPDVVSHEVDLAAAEFDGARITAFVPVLVNRQVRIKLRQLASSAA